MAFQTETKDEILQRMINKIVARSGLNDVTQTGEFFKVLVAISRQLERIYHGMEDLLDDTDLDQAAGVELDERAKMMNPDEITRDLETAGTGQVQFGRSTPAPGPITIAVGSEVKVPDLTASEELKYTTTTLGTILTGAVVSNLVSVLAQEAGSKYNVSPNAITGFGAKPSGVDTVTNPAVIVTGTDNETDDSFRSRIKLYLKALSRATASSLLDVSMGVVDSITGKVVSWVGVWEDEYDPGKVIVYIDDGAGTAESTSTVAAEPVLTAAGGEVDISLPNYPIHESYAFALYVNAVLVPTANYFINYANGHIKLKAAAYPTGLTAADAVTYDGTNYTGLVAEVQKVADGDVADRNNYPGYRAAGIYVRVRVPQIVSQTVAANITVNDGYDQSTAVTAVVAAIQDYINKLSVGEDVLRNELIERIMGVTGVYNVNLTMPSGDVLITDTQLARTISAGITVT
jgi:uncharacterized phage protein gp47/JayE